MWDDQKRQRFIELRQPNHQLTPVERTELAALVNELEDVEAAYLRPTSDRLRQENDLTAKRIERLDKLVQRKQVLAQRLAKVLSETQAERRAIECELATVLAENQAIDMED